MQTITTKQLADYLKEYDEHKGAYRNGVITSWLVGSDEPNIVKLKKFYDSLINIEENRALYPIEVFQLSRIVVAAKTKHETLSDNLFEKLRDAYGRNIIAALTVLHDYHSEYKLYNEDNFNKILAANDPAHVARVIAAMNILHATELNCARVAGLREQVEQHSAPIRLAEGVKGVTMHGYRFNTEENLQKVLSSGDPLRTMEEIMLPVVAPDFDITNPGYFPKLKLAYHMKWSTFFGTANSGEDVEKKDHDASSCPELQPAPNR